MGQRVLIAGGSGQVGSALQASAGSGVEVVAPPSTSLDICRTLDVEAVFAAVQPDVVINAAAYTAVDEAETEQERAFAVNAVGAANLARACSSSGSVLIHLSTDYVFDGSKRGAYQEQDTPAPINVYGQSKLAGERMILDVLDRHVILRVSWVFSAVGSNFVKTMIGLAERPELRVVDDQLGTPCGASDIADCVWRIVDRLAMDARFGVYHFRTTPETTWCRFAAAIFSLLRGTLTDGRVPVVIPITTDDYPTRAARPRNSVLDGSKLMRDYEIRAPDWHVDLRSVVEHLASNCG